MLLAAEETSALSGAVLRIYSKKGFVTARDVFYELHRYDDKFKGRKADSTELRSIAQYLSRMETTRILNRQSKSMRKYVLEEGLAEY